MPLIRRLITVGDSRAVTIPSDWLKYYEDKLGQPIEEVLMEINHVITVSVREPQPEARPNKEPQDTEKTKEAPAPKG